MRKYFFLWSAVVIGVLILILAFANIWMVQQYFILFFTINTSSTFIILLSSLLGFLVGFFAMLYSYEIQKEKRMKEESDLIGTSPLEQESPEPAPKPQDLQESEKPSLKPDGFDEDDEVLG